MCATRSLGSAASGTSCTGTPRQGHHEAKVRRALRGHPNAVTLYTTNGRWDLVAELRTDTLEAFDQVPNAIRQIPGIANTEINILLSTHKA